MKKTLAIFIALCFCLTAVGFALDYSADFRIKTGDADLDLRLTNVNAQSSTPGGALEVRKELTRDYGLTQKELDFLSKQGYKLAEIQYLALLARQSGKPVNQVAALHSKGIGWGVLAKKLGVQPSALRKLVIRSKKAEKMMIRKPFPSRPSKVPGMQGGGRGPKR